MAAFRPDDSDERDMVLEDYGQHVSADAAYDLTMDELDAAITQAALLVDGIGAEIAFEQEIASATFYALTDPVDRIVLVMEDAA